MRAMAFLFFPPGHTRRRHIHFGFASDHLEYTAPHSGARQNSPRTFCGFTSGHTISFLLIALLASRRFMPQTESEFGGLAFQFPRELI